jgi:endoribonuclease Dicer
MTTQQTRQCFKKSEKQRYCLGFSNTVSINAEILQAKMREFCGALPEDRLLLGNKHIRTQLESSRRSWTDPLTGAKLTYMSSIQILAEFLAQLVSRQVQGPLDLIMTISQPCKRDEPIAQPKFYVVARQGGFKCEVLLPSNCPIQNVVGQVETRKSVSKQSAAFDACLILREKKLINEFLQPTHKISKPKMANARLALKSKPASSYSMRTKPSFWKASIGKIPFDLFVTVIEPSEMCSTATMDMEYRPLLMLTRSRLPRFPQFPVHFSNESRSQITTISLQGAITMDEEKLALLTAFTLNSFLAVFNKGYRESIKDIPYWLAPLAPGFQFSSSTIASTCHLNWELMHSIKTQWVEIKKDFSDPTRIKQLGWVPGTPEIFYDHKFIIDPLDGSRRFFSQSVTRKYAALDPIPENVRISVKGNRAPKTILEFSNSAYAKSRAKAQFYPEQPVIQVLRMSLRRNYLDRPTATEMETSSSPKCFICPEPMIISSVSFTIITKIE